MPGVWGSLSWNSGAFDPDTGIYYAVSMTLPTLYGMRTANAPKEQWEDKAPSAWTTVDMRISMPPAPAGLQGLPLLKPLYGRVTALDMNKGETILGDSQWRWAPQPSPAASLNLPSAGNDRPPRASGDQNAAVPRREQ